MTLRRLSGSARDFRTKCVEEADAVIGLVGGNGTSDCIQKAVLARKPVFPIATAGGNARLEWERLKDRNYYNRYPGDIDFLDDSSAAPDRLAAAVIAQCQNLLTGEKPPLPRKIFIVHGRSGELKNELARLLTKLNFKPVILAEQADSGKTVKEKLLDKVQDVGYAFVLYTPDDIGGLASEPSHLHPRARQNVIFEHGLLLGVLGPSRVCAIVQEGSTPIEGFSDLSGVLQKRVPMGLPLETVAVAIIRDLQEAGYEIDARLLLEGAV